MTEHAANKITINFKDLRNISIVYDPRTEKNLRPSVDEFVTMCREYTINNSTSDDTNKGYKHNYELPDVGLLFL